MRNQQFEVPFIAFYRKEYVLPELSVNDLWKVYKYDGKVIYVCGVYFYTYLIFAHLTYERIFNSGAN